LGIVGKPSLNKKSSTSLSFIGKQFTCAEEYARALYYIRSPVKPVKELQKSRKIVSPLFEISSQPRTKKDEFTFGALSEPVESPPTEIEPEPEKVLTPPEYVFPEYEPEPEEVPTPDDELELSQIQDQVDKPLKFQAHEK